MKDIIHYAIEHGVAWDGNLEKVKEWLDQGADINIQTTDGHTLLIWVSLYNRLDITKLLVSRGAKINIQNKWGYTALFRAVLWGYHTTIEFLISKGAKINIPNNDGYTPLTWNSRFIEKYRNLLKGPLSLQHITLNLIEEKNISHEDLPDVLFLR